MVTPSLNELVLNVLQRIGNGRSLAVMLKQAANGCSLKYEPK